VDACMHAVCDVSSLCMQCTYLRKEVMQLWMCACMWSVDLCACMRSVPACDACMQSVDVCMHAVCDVSRSRDSVTACKVDKKHRYLCLYSVFVFVLGYLYSYFGTCARTSVLVFVLGTRICLH